MPDIRVPKIRSSFLNREKEVKKKADVVCSIIIIRLPALIEVKNVTSKN